MIFILEFSEISIKYGGARYRLNRIEHRKKDEQLIIGLSLDVKLRHANFGLFFYEISLLDFFERNCPNNCPVLRAPLPVLISDFSGYEFM